MKLYSQNIWNHDPCKERNRMIASLVKAQDADVCAFQECGPRTNRTGEAPIQTLLEDTYAEAAPQFADRNYTPVFYKREKFRVLDSGYLLYRGKNDENSKSVTWAVLKERENDVSFAVLSTHFWWMAESEADDLQRIENARELRDLCEIIKRDHQVPVIVGGDFNNGTNAEQGDRPYRAMLEMGFSDFRKIANVTCTTHTHHAYPDEDDLTPNKTIDHIFSYGNEINVESFEILTDTTALSTSDHCPLVGVWK